VSAIYKPRIADDVLDGGDSTDTVESGLGTDTVLGHEIDE
jgi:hypothetical protein